MGKKKQKPNAFSVFMFEFLQREKERGKSYPRVKQINYKLFIYCILIVFDFFAV